MKQVVVRAKNRKIHVPDRLVLLIAAVFALFSLAQGQQSENQGQGSAIVPAGTSKQRLVVNIAKPPAIDDFIRVTVSTNLVKTTLITPNQQRITAEDAEGAGLDWQQGGAHEPPLGSDDVGQSDEITFRNPAPAGRYVVEFAFQNLAEPAKVQARFISRMGEYLRLMHSVPGTQILKPAPLNPSATVAIDLPADDEDRMFDVLVPDNNTDVAVVLPDGRILRRKDATANEIDWKIVAEQEKTLFVGVLQPVKGSHHLIGFNKAAKGRYQIRATQQKAGTGELRVASFPFTLLVKAWGEEMNARERPAPGTVKVRPKPLPYECFVGEKLDVQFELLGDVGPDAPQFEVRLEHRWLHDTETGPKYASPDPVETMPVQFDRIGERSYGGSIALAKPGMVRITVTAKGHTASGKPFVDEELITNSYVMVKPIVARFSSITASAVGPGDSKFDQLDVSANLEVLVPGNYSMSFTLQDAAGNRLLGPPFGGGASLQVGQQKLTLSVPSTRIWQDLRDGPLEISGVQIWRTQQSAASSVRVPTGDAKFRTTAYRRDQWNPGPIYGDDHVSVRAIAPASSGRFLFAEVEWEVTTPGGLCEWDARLQGSSGHSGDDLLGLKAQQKAQLPSGKTKVSFVFDGAKINRLEPQEWMLVAALRCDISTKTHPVDWWRLNPAPKIRLNPDDFEPSQTSFSVNTSQMLRLLPGGSGKTTLVVLGKNSQDVQFHVGDLPAGVDANLANPLRTVSGTFRDLTVTTAPGTAPGRYFIGINAVSGSEVATTKLILDIDKSASNLVH